MNRFQFLIVVLLMILGEFVNAQTDEAWMYGWQPAETQQDYDQYIARLYVTKPYSQDDYERDVYRLYAQLKDDEKISQYCDGKMKNGLKVAHVVDIKAGYQLWRIENKAYIETVSSLWNQLIKNADHDKKLELSAKLERQNRGSIENLRLNGRVDSSCTEVALHFAYKDPITNRIIGRQSEEKKFSDAYRNIDFFLHPDKKEKFIKALKTQLDTASEREKACKSEGKTWQAGGIMGRMGCVTKYSDAGKPCSKDSQCKGGCMRIPADNGQVSGLCREDDSGYGCFETTDANGKPTGTMCVD